MTPSGAGDHKIEPEYLGPLADRPLVETTHGGGPADLFPGASKYLAARHQRRRREQWSASAPAISRLLRPDEHVLYVTHGMEIAPTLQMMALGYLALTYHQVLLVVTDTRLVELTLDFRGKKPGTRLRSYPWGSVREMTLRFGKLRLTPVNGRKQFWRVPLRGDRKVLDLLVNRLKPRLAHEGEARSQPLPLWHCPQCAANVPPRPQSCPGCRTTFRSSRLATMLALAFPGAGLLYSGHPVLALGDFVKEAFLYMVALMLLLEAEPDGVVVAIGIGLFLLAVAKLHSVNLSRVLVARSVPETEGRRTGYGRLALIGGMVSLLLVGGAFPLIGAGRQKVDRDLDVVARDGSWQVSRKTADWKMFADDATARSQWRHSSGLRVTLFAYPLHLLQDASEFRAGFREAAHQQGATLAKDDEDVPAPFRGFRFVWLTKKQDGTPVAIFHYFILDEENHDVHHAIAAVVQSESDRADALVRDFLAHARWIEATPPERSAPHPVPAG